MMKIRSMGAIMVSRQYARKLERIAQGLCRDCGKNESLVEGKVICLSCSQKRSVLQKRWHKQQKESGMCYRCKRNVPQPGTNLCVECREKQVQYYREKRKSAKERIYAHFGRKCATCDETDIRCMSIDHVNNDASSDPLVNRRSNGSRYATSNWYEKILAQIEKSEQGSELQMLCFNCHAKKDLAPWWFENPKDQ